VVAASTARHIRWIAATLATASGIVIFAGLVLEHRVIYLPVMADLPGLHHRSCPSPDGHYTQIDADILCGAAAIYFLIGVVCAMIGNLYIALLVATSLPMNGEATSRIIRANNRPRKR